MRITSAHYYNSNSRFLNIHPIKYPLTALSLAVILTFPFTSNATQYLQPALTQGDDFAGLVWWHDGKLYAKDESGYVQELQAVNVDGERVTTAKIYGDIEGYTLGFNFGWQASTQYPTNTLVLDFQGNVNVGYGVDSPYTDAAAGDVAMVSTDTFNMGLKFQNDKTLYIGSPREDDTAIELIDYISAGGTPTSSINNMYIQGGHLVTRFDEAYEENGGKLIVIGSYKNFNGPILPGDLTINNQSVSMTLGKDFQSIGVDTYGIKANYSTIDIQTGSFNLGSKDYGFYVGFAGGMESTTKIKTGQFNAYTTNYGVWVKESSSWSLEANEVKFLISDNSSGNTYGVYGNSGNATFITNSLTFGNQESPYYTAFYGSNAATVGIQTQAFDLCASKTGVYVKGGSSWELSAGSANFTLTGNDNAYAFQTSGTTSSISARANELNVNFTSSGGNSDNVLVYANQGKVDLKANKLSVAYGGNVSDYRILAYNGAEVLINKRDQVSDSIGTVFMSGSVYAVSDSIVKMNLGGNSHWEGFATTRRSDGSGSAGNIDLLFTNEAKWDMTSNSTITNLTFEDGGYVNLFRSASSSYRTLTTDTLSGKGGTLGFRIDLASDAIGNIANDQLIVNESASGSHYASITFQGDAVSLDKTYSENWLVSQEDSDGSVSFKNWDGTNKFTGNGMIRTWSLLFTEDETVDESTQWSQEGSGKGYWHLVQTGLEEEPKPDPDPELPPEAEQITNLGSSVAQAVGWLSEKNDLRRRLGEVRYGAQAGAWAKAFTRQDRAEGFRYNGFKQNSTGVHIGYDTFVSKSEGSAWLVGGTLRYARSDQEGLETAYGGDGKLNEYTAKVYATWMHESGSYADILAQVGYYDQEIIGRNNVGNAAFDADYHNMGYGASIEVGHMFTLSNGADDRRWYNHWFFEPQAELSYFYVVGKDFTTSTGLKVDQGDAEFLTGRLGFVLGKKFNYGTLDDLDKRYFQAGLIAGVTHEFLGDQDIRFTGVDGGQATVSGHGLGGTSYYYGVTFDWQVADRWRIYGELDAEEGKYYTKDYGFNVGVKYAF